MRKSLRNRTVCTASCITHAAKKKKQKKLNAYLLEGTLGEQVPLDAAECLVRVVVRLLDQAQLLPLDGVQPRVHAVVLLQPLQREDEELRVCVCMMDLWHTFSGVRRLAVQEWTQASMKGACRQKPRLVRGGLLNLR